jgi:hypothetical protein
MNKTLLLILCDFLLLNLLALTRWEKVDEQILSDVPPPVASPEQPRPDVPVGDKDLLAVMQASLEQEQMEKSEIGGELESAHEELVQKNEVIAERERLVAEREAQLSLLESQLSQKSEEVQLISSKEKEARSGAEVLEKQLAMTSEEMEMIRIQSRKLQEELASQKEVSEQLLKNVDVLKQEKDIALSEVQNLNTQVNVVQAERALLKENVEELKGEVAIVREEKLKLQEQTGILAEGVSDLADQSAGLREDILSNVPVNANTLFDSFQKNRIQVKFQAFRSTFLGPVTREKSTKTVLVQKDDKIYAIFHVEDSVLSLRGIAVDWESLEGFLMRTDEMFAVEGLQFLDLDPRIVVAEVKEATATFMGTDVYSLANEPFKFEEAILVDGDGNYYGETVFKLDDETPGYVKMESKIFSRIFGEFSPSRGDLVFSKTGDLLGIMVNNSYCVMIDRLLTSEEVRFGEQIGDQETSNVLNAMKSRLNSLPPQLQ